MIRAFWLFHSLNKHKCYFNSYAYEKCREDFHQINVEAGHNTKWTEERKRQQSELMKGKVLYERTDEIKEKISITLKQKYAKGELISPFVANNPNKGKHLSEEHKAKLIAALKGRHLSDQTKDKIRKAKQGINNPMYGKPCYYKMTEEEILAWKTNLRKGNRKKHET